MVAWGKSAKIRVCVDLRKPNEAVIEDKFPLPTVDEMPSEMHGVTHFSNLDLKSAYPHVIFCITLSTHAFSPCPSVLSNSRPGNIY